MYRHIVSSKNNEESYLEISMSEYGLIKNSIKSPKNVLELGCGLGRMSVYINSQLQDDSIHYILADSTQYLEEPNHGWEPKGGFYNDLSLTKRFADDNGMTNFETFNLITTNITTLKNIDLVMSFFSVGFHYSIESYLNDLLDITTDDCVMIFGIRRGIYTEEDFEYYFDNIEIITNEKLTKEDILILSK